MLFIFRMATLNQVDCSVLGIGADADPEAIKSAYRRLVRRNHPDLFQGEERVTQELRMMRINEAYDRLLRAFEVAGDDGWTGAGESGRGPRVPGWDYDLHGKDPVLSGSRQMGRHKDPAYAYYKQGFIKYSEGAGGMHIHRRRKLSPDERGLDAALSALRCFQEAHTYFQRVVDDFPESIWARDASYRLYRIERFVTIYRRIQRNIKSRLGPDEKAAPA